MLKVAIIGCGKIADQHAHAIGRIPDSRIVAVCDQEILMARQLAGRFGHPAAFSDVETMLREAAPQLVHITTPPQSHFSLAKQCLAAGCHVYLEKPFTVTAPEAEELIRLAEASGVRITAGHNLQFTLEMLEMRRGVAAGILGGKPVHLESHFTYGLDDANYVGPLLGDRNHWVRRLPGQLFHNVVSHGIAKLVEFLDDGPVEVVARAHQSARLCGLGGGEVLDELRVLLRDRSGTTAFFCFSTQLKPGLNLLRVCGPAGSLVVDHASGTLTRQTIHADKSYLTFFLPPLRQAAQHFGAGCRNILSFLHRRLHQDSGLKELIERFHRCILAGGAPPIPYREILLTARIMDDIFAQVYAPPPLPEGTVVAHS